MSYIINKTDGTVLTEVVDGTIDQTTTDLTLIGKNSSTYGEFLNENFVKLLENFASTSSPTNPIAGQLWFDTTENRLKVYDGNGFRVSGGTVVSSTVPSGLVQGDIWIDSARKQLFFYDGTQLTLAGPPYTTQQGLTGITIESVLDTNQISHTVAFLYVGQALLGLWSKDQFTPSSPIIGFSGTVFPGWNTGTLTGVEYRGTATRARELISADGSIKTAEAFITKVEDAATTGKFTILNSVPLVLGAAQNTEFRVDANNFNIVSNNSGQDFAVKSKNGASLKSALQVKALSERVGIFTENPEATLDVNGPVIVRGDLTVEGNSTFINTSNLEVEDKTIELSKIATPTNDTADGGGIILKGASDKTILWNKDVNNIANSNWNISEHVNLPSSKTFKINNIEVLSSTSLGNTVESAPGLRSLGNLFSLTVDNININDNTISSLNTNGNIVLNPNGIGYVDVSSAQVKNVANPTDANDAVNLVYFQQYVTSFPLGISLDVTGLSAVSVTLRAQISTILNDIFPASQRPAGTVCRVYTSRQTISYPSITLTSGNTGGENINWSAVSVDKAGIQESQSVLQSIATNPIDAGNATITYERRVFTYIVGTGSTAWEYDSDVAPTTLPT